MKNYFIGLLAMVSVSVYANTSCDVFIKADDRVISYLNSRNVDLESCKTHGEDALAWYNGSGERKFYGFRRVIAKHTLNSGKKNIETVLIIKD